MTDDALWYKDAVFYELHVKAYADANGDGIGDFPGLIGRLDYLQDLGVTCLWLLPMYPSPFRDDGYDISDYCNVHPAYGTLEDFQALAGRPRTSAACGSSPSWCSTTPPTSIPGSRRRAPAATARERDYYVWSDSDDRYRDARIIFRDTELSNWAWDPVSKAYYWHRFFSHQPDLNFDNPAVREEIWQVMRFWLDLGVDGFRVDAVPYLVEREGTSCENLPETHAVIVKLLRRRMDAEFPGRLLLAEANMWPEDVRPYFGDGDEFHMAFHFPLMPRMFMALRLEDRKPIVEIVERTPEIPDGLPVGPVPAQPRRADARDGDRRRAGLHVRRVRAATRSARINLGIRRRLAPLLEGRPPAHRADERAAVLAAGQPRPLLRRRDRHGRQRLPRRPQRRAHADAVERRLERRLLDRRPGAALPAPDLEPGLRLPGGQRRVASAGRTARCSTGRGA